MRAPGSVALALAPLAGSVPAVDISPVMAESLAARAAQAGLGNVATGVADLRAFQLPAASVDLVVSSYTLHHLRDEDKRTLAAEAVRWLRPGGRIVVADMMFGRGATRRDRRILREKVTAFAVRGPAGWWRIAKNLTRYGFGVGHEHPATPQFWQLALREAGFTDVRFEPPGPAPPFPEEEPEMALRQLSRLIRRLAHRVQRQGFRPLRRGPVIAAWDVRPYAAGAHGSVLVRWGWAW